MTRFEPWHIKHELSGSGIGSEPSTRIPITYSDAHSRSWAAWGFAPSCLRSIARRAIAVDTDAIFAASLLLLISQPQNEKRPANPRCCSRIGQPFVLAENLWPFRIVRFRYRLMFDFHARGSNSPGSVLTFNTQLYPIALIRRKNNHSPGSVQCHPFASF